MRRTPPVASLLVVVACGGSRDAWTDADRAPSDDLQAALAGDETAPDGVGASAPPELPAGPPKPLAPDDLQCAAPWRCTAHPRWQGRAPEEVKARLGKPFFESDAEWHYMVEREGCRAPSQRLVFHWPGGRVHFRWSRADLSCFPEVELPERVDVATASLRGADESAVLAALGVPDYAEDHRWTYRVPDGCAEERDVTTIAWADGKVHTVRKEHVHTGEHCEPISL